MNQIKIVHVTTVAQSLQGLLLNQMKTLQSAGYHVSGISSPGAKASSLEQAGIRHIAVPMSRQVTPILDAVALARLYDVMRRERFTIVHTHTPKAGLLGQVAARLARVPIVINTVHGYYMHDRMHPLARRFYIALEKMAARCSDMILSQNREDIEIAVSQGICSPRKLAHLGNGIDLSLFDVNRMGADVVRDTRAQLGIPCDVKVVGFVGRLAGKRKGFTDFLVACRAVADEYPGVRFLIVGDADVGKADAVGSAAAQDYGIAEQCIFLGSRPNTDLPALYSVMDVLVLPSLFEGIPRVVMEAAAMGIPAVVTDVKGNREAVEHGRNGLLVPLGDTKALAQAILRILMNSEEARRMGIGGHHLAQDRFDERKVFARVLEQYARLLQERNLCVPTSVVDTE